MKLHYHPVSTVSRPVALFAADTHRARPPGVDPDRRASEGSTARSSEPPRPVLEDGDFRLTELAILRYLADKSTLRRIRRT
jgi:glutathione S-transferase